MQKFEPPFYIAATIQSLRDFEPMAKVVISLPHGVQEELTDLEK